MARRLFCEISPLTYRISMQKEILLRHAKDLFSRETLARDRDPAMETHFPNVVKAHASILRRRLHGVDMRLQENKITNLRLAAEKLNTLVIAPGETFSFWHIVGPTDERHGFKTGLVIAKNGFVEDWGGGLCQMANLIHWLVLNSPLTVTELHHHSDALFPDERRRVPFGTGTSVCYNNIDYRFRNDTDQPVGLLIWLTDEELCGELRSERPYPCRYRLTEENHHFRREGEKYYRISQVYRTVIDRESGEVLRRELILDNHSAVMYDPALIPPDEIREDDEGQDGHEDA